MAKIKKVKKAQLGDHVYRRQSQDDRIHRIEKKDPERAKRVAARVEKRALRPPSQMSIPLRERAKAARERKAAEAAKAPKAQKGDSLVYETPGTRYPKKRIAIDTAGYAGGKKTFKGTTKYMEDLAGNPKEYGEKSRKFGSRGIKSLLEFKAKKAEAPKKKTGGKVSKKLLKK